MNAGIREISRAGRGYSFEALRAKVLFTRGAHKTERVRPKFQRQSDGFVGYSMARCTPDFGEAERNYGADINTLLRILREDLAGNLKHN